MSLKYLSYKNYIYYYFKFFFYIKIFYKVLNIKKYLKKKYLKKKYLKKIMISVCHGIEYYIVLNENIDKFEVLPDIEKETKYELIYNHLYIDNEHDVYSAPYPVITIISQNQSDNRLLQSSYYKERKNKWFDLSHPDIKTIDNNLVNDMILTDKEKNVLELLLTHKYLQGKIKSYGWYDVILYC
jgi:hypothetical protein